MRNCSARPARSTRRSRAARMTRLRRSCRSAQSPLRRRRSARRPSPRPGHAGEAMTPEDIVQLNRSDLSSCLTVETAVKTSDGVQRPTTANAKLRGRSSSPTSRQPWPRQERRFRACVLSVRDVCPPVTARSSRADQQGESVVTVGLGIPQSPRRTGVSEVPARPDETGRDLRSAEEPQFPCKTQKGRDRPRPWRRSVNPKVEGSNPSRPTRKVPAQRVSRFGR